MALSREDTPERERSKHYKTALTKTFKLASVVSFCGCCSSTTVSMNAFLPRNNYIPTRLCLSSLKNSAGGARVDAFFNKAWSVCCINRKKYKIHANVNMKTCLDYSRPLSSNHCEQKQIYVCHGASKSKHYVIKNGQLISSYSLSFPHMLCFELVNESVWL